MKVIVPFANAETDPVSLEAVTRNLREQRVDARFARIEGDIGYSVLFNNLWTAGEPLPG